MESISTAFICFVNASNITRICPSVYVEAYMCTCKHFSHTGKNRNVNIIFEERRNDHLELFWCYIFIRKNIAYFVARVSFGVERFFIVVSIFFC